MPDKEKLVELLITSDDYENSVCLGYPCKVCPYKGEDCTYKAQADHLIANGVTVQDVHDTNVGEWISVKDRLPEPFVPVLICREKEPGKRIVEQGYKDLGKWWKVYGTRVTQIIGWMPMPQPPAADGTNAPAEQ